MRRSRFRHVLVVACAGALLLAACGPDGDDTLPAPVQVAGPVDVTPAADAVPVAAAPLVDARTVSITPELTPRSEMPLAPSTERHVSYAPDVPPPVDRIDQRVFTVHLEVLEGVCPLDPANSIDTEMWGFRVAGDVDVVCGSPGPVLRGRVGDVARITLTNLASNEHPHNIDFHAVTGQGGGAADLTVGPGETASIETRLLYPGAFMYHCAFGDVPKHIAYGMYGMFIVDPAEPLHEVEHEWAVMQSEWYVTEANDSGVVEYDGASVVAEEPRYVTFNGRTDALVGDNALRMRVGERARIYMVNEGLNLVSNFHPIGSHWDMVYPEAATHPINSVIRGSQSTLVVAGGGTVVELVGQVPSTVLLVDHALSRTFYKGAVGQVVIEGDTDPEIFNSAPTGDLPDATPPVDRPTVSDTAAPPSASTEAVATDKVEMPAGAFDPANAEIAYSPRNIVVSAGTTVTWTNSDSVVHTVTSGTTTGTVGTADGVFDSGDIAPGERFSITFETPGTYPYFCNPHPWMSGTVTVSA